MPSLECEAVLFDLDGVLIDSGRCVARHWEAWAAQHGIDVEDIMRKAHGVRSVETIRRVAPDLDAEHEAAQFSASELEDTVGVIAQEGAIGLVGDLPAGSWGIVTSASRELAMARLRTAGLPVPDVLVGGDDVTRGKPDPEGYLIGASRFRKGPEDCLALEDSPAGIEAAQAARMPVIGVSTTHPREAMACQWAVDSLAVFQIEIRSGTRRTLVISFDPK